MNIDPGHLPPTEDPGTQLIDDWVRIRRRIKPLVPTRVRTPDLEPVA